MTLQRINPEALPIKINIDGTEWIIFRNEVTNRLEQFLLGDNIELTVNKATDFSVINDVKYPTTKAVDNQKGIANGIASLDSDGLLDPTQIPPIAITKVVVAVETTISSFAANSDNYIFEQGDVILIDDAGDVQHYLFKGGLKTDVNEYSLINATEITISQVVGLQSVLDGKASLSDDQTFTGINTFTGATTNLNSIDTNILGNVGIGTTTKITKVDVNGGLAVKAQDNTSALVLFLRDINNLSSLTMRSFTTKTQFRAQNGKHFEIIADTGDVLFYGQNGGDVSIGNTSPLSRLHIKDETNNNLQIGSVSNIMSISSKDDMDLNAQLDFYASGYNFKSGNSIFEGSIQATSFIGDGSQLTGINNKQVFNTQTAKYVSLGTGFPETYYTYNIPANTLNIGDIIEINYTGRVTNTSGGNSVNIGLSNTFASQTFVNANPTSFNGLLRIIVTGATTASYIFISNDYPNFSGSNNNRNRFTSTIAGFDTTLINSVSGSLTTSNAGGIEVDIVSVEIKRN